MMSDGASAVRIGKRLIHEREVVDGIRVLSRAQDDDRIARTVVSDWP
jgi:hypothetical protein